MQRGSVNHDTALLVTLATALGFTCVFGGVVTLKVHVTLHGGRDEQQLRQARHISLFGDKVVRERRREEAGAAPTASTADFRLISIYSLVTILTVFPYIVMLFCASARSGNIARAGEELAILLLRLTPLLDFGVLLLDLVFRSRIIVAVKSLDYKLGCFYLRNVLCVGKVSPRSTILVNPTGNDSVEDDHRESIED